MSYTTQTATTVPIGQTMTIKQTKEWVIKNRTCPLIASKSNPLDVSKINANRIKRPYQVDVIAKIPTVEEYLKDRRSPITFNDSDIVILAKKDREKPGTHQPRLYRLQYEIEPFEYCFIRVNDKGQVSYMGSKIPNISITSIDEGNNLGYRTTVSSLINSGIVKNGQLILNADDSSNDLVSETKDYPALSFECLANLIADKVITKDTERLELIRKSNFSVLDWTQDIRLKASPTVINAYKARGNKTLQQVASKLTPPQKGMSLVKASGLGVEWHKPSTVVLQHGKRNFVIGQDEGTYFGCILADHPETVEDAFSSLVPEEARGIKGVLRQGEWFAVPVSEKDIPNEFDISLILVSDDGDGLYYLPREDKDSNIHCLSASETRITKSGDIFVKSFSLNHNDHATLEGETGIWYTFYRNTAKASYSGKNVD